MTHQEILDMIQSENCTVVNQERLWGIWDTDLQEWAIDLRHTSRQAALEEFASNFADIQNEFGHYWSALYNDDCFLV